MTADRIIAGLEDLIRHEGQITIVCAGKPVPWSRAGSLGKQRFTPAHVRHWQDYIKLEARMAMRGRPPIEGPVRLYVTAFMPIARSWSKKRTAAALEGIERPTGKPDLSNLEKAAEDALNTVVYRDDAQIVEKRSSKLYDEGAGPRLEIIVEPLGA